MKVAIYVRVSTRDKQDISTQIQYLNDYAQRNGLEIHNTYKDNGESGSKENRPSFDRMLDDMRQGYFEGILVYKLDRIGRSTIHLLKLFEEFNSKHIEFISATQNINTTTPEGRMFLRMLMIMAEYERELTIDRIISGLARARKEGKRLGRPNGSKDTKRRRRAGYINRYLKEKR